jgi:hypothetical protein
MGGNRYAIQIISISMFIPMGFLQPHSSHAGHGLSTFVHPSHTAFCVFLQPDIPPYPYPLLLVYMLCRPFTSGSICPVPTFACPPSVCPSSTPWAFRTPKNASVHMAQRPLHKRTNPLGLFASAVALCHSASRQISQLQVFVLVCAIGEAGNRAQWCMGIGAHGPV